jgi:hypothetical protein
MRLLASILLTAFLWSCSGSNSGEIEGAFLYGYEDFGVPVKLKGEIIPVDTVWKPNRIWCEDSLLILIEPSEDYLVQLYHKEKGTKIAENIPYGTGPGERLNCWSLQIDSENVWAFDMQMSSLTAYNKSDFLTQSYILPTKTIRLKGEASTGLVHLSSGLLVSSSLADPENLLSVYDESGVKDTSRMIPYPVLKHLVLSGDIAERFFENRIYYNEASDKIVLFYVYTDLIDIYDSKFRLLARIHGPDKFIPEMGVSEVEGKKHVHTIAHKTKFACLSGYLTADEIWTLYYGISPERGKELQDRIFVYNYEGKPLRAYQLEYPVSVFCIDEDSHVLYGLSEQPEPCVIKFVMPEK